MIIYGVKGKEQATVPLVCGMGGGGRLSALVLGEHSVQFNSVQSNSAQFTYIHFSSFQAVYYGGPISWEKRVSFQVVKKKIISYGGFRLEKAKIRLESTDHF